MPSKNKKQAARADAQAVETAVEDERQKAELLAERPNVGKSSLRGNPDEVKDLPLTSHSLSLTRPTSKQVTNTSL